MNLLASQHLNTCCFYVIVQVDGLGFLSSKVWVWYYDLK